MNSLTSDVVLQNIFMEQYLQIAVPKDEDFSTLSLTNPSVE